ncbi:hypothetical protein [Shewanella sp.]|uniref:hypothetical protein n=1 Tax=Shewanella sp. TaxID=50422 RepID=UPI003567B0A7
MFRLFCLLLLSVLLAACNSTPKPRLPDTVPHNQSSDRSPGMGKLETQYRFAEQIAQRLNSKDLEGFWNRELVLENLRRSGEEPLHKTAFSQVFEDRFKNVINLSSDWHVSAIRDGQILLSGYVQDLPNVMVLYFSNTPNSFTPALIDWQLQDTFAKGSAVYNAYIKHAQTISSSGFAAITNQYHQQQQISTQQIIEVYQQLSDEAKQDAIIMGDFLSLVSMTIDELPEDLMQQMQHNFPTLTTVNAQPWIGVAIMAGDLETSRQAIAMGKAQYGETISHQRLANAALMASKGFTADANKEFLEYSRARPEDVHGFILYFMLLVETGAFDDAAVIRQAMRLQFGIDIVSEMQKTNNSEKLRQFMSSTANNTRH